MKTITFALYNQLSNRNIDYQEHVKFITEFSFNQMLGVYRRGNAGKIIPVEDTSINNIILAADGLGTDYLLIAAYGFRSLNMRLHELLVDHAEKNQLAVVGHILLSLIHI